MFLCLLRTCEARFLNGVMRPKLELTAVAKTIITASTCATEQRSVQLIETFSRFVEGSLKDSPFQKPGAGHSWDYMHFTTGPFLSCPWKRHLSWDVPVECRDGGFFHAVKLPGSGTRWKKQQTSDILSHLPNRLFVWSVLVKTRNYSNFPNLDVASLL